MRPNGMVERWQVMLDLPEPSATYGRAKPGRSSGEALRRAALRDRRRRPRHGPEPLRGRLLDVGA